MTRSDGFVTISRQAWEVIGKPEHVSFKVDLERRALVIHPTQGGYSVKVLADQASNQSDDLLRLYPLKFENGTLILELGNKTE